MSSKSTEERNDGQESYSKTKRAKIHEGEDGRRSDETSEAPRAGAIPWQETANASIAREKALHEEEMKAMHEQLAALKAEKAKSDARAQAEHERAEAEQARAQAEHERAEAEHARAEAAHARAEASDAEAYEKSIARLVEQPFDVTFKGEGASSSHVGPNGHTPATTHEKEIKLENIQDDRKITELWRKRPSTFISALWDKIHEEKPDQSPKSLKLTYNSEADVSDCIGSMVKDAMALATMKTGRTFAMHHEFSMFSIRPDHVVVVDRDTGAPILVVEDKMPLNCQLDDHVHRFVLGQVLDYIKVTRAFGNSIPFVVLSTFDKSWLCWQDDEESNKLAMDLEARRDALAKYFTTDSPLRQKSDQEKKTSPSPRAIKEERMTGEGIGVAFSATTKKINDRSLFISKEVGSNDLVGLLYTAILCGLCRNPNSQKHVLQRYPTGYDGEAMKLQKNKRGYTWGHLVCRTADNQDSNAEEIHDGGAEVKQDGSRSNCIASLVNVAFCRGSKRKTVPKVADGAYYIIDLIGRGATSKAFLAFDGDGKECVIKMYVKKDDEKGEIMSKKSMTKRAKERCNYEVQNFKKIYGDNPLNVSCARLNGFWCVIMPFFRPLPKSERATYLRYHKIEAVLQRFGKNGLEYRETDIRWRHVGLHGNNEVVMFDLADLVAFDKKQAKKMVQNSLTILDRRCQHE